MNTAKKNPAGFNVLRLSLSSLYGFLIILILFSQPLISADGNDGNLVSVNWLEKNLNNPEIVILDASPAKIYSEKHIPGAVSVDLFSWFGLQEKSIPEMENLFQSWGISPRKKIVMYDQGGSIWAARLFFSLYYYGFPQENLLLLDGGFTKWNEQNLAVTKDLPGSKEKGTFNIINLNENVRVRLPEVLTASGDPVNYVLVDAVTPEWHYGEVLAFNRPGHIPNAKMLPSADFYNADKTFKSAEEIKSMLDYLDINPGQKVYTHCGGGIAASVPFFALKFILDYTDVALYSESQLGWLSDERQLPYWTYDSQHLIRDTEWLQFWGGQMLRMYGGSKVSIVDIRSENSFKEGHVPFAINIPAEVFKSNISSLDKLPGILGTEGIKPLDEAVIISGEGLTKESALVFLVMQKLGQKKVSIFKDSMNKWTELGFNLIKDSSSVVTNAKTRDDGSVINTENIRKDIIISDLKSTQGIYPKMLIASGVNVPDQHTREKVIHLPYNEFLNNDGTPKAAKEIWKTLSKAGVPRYAELICYSDDPGEAAVNYFILKLMGYPDIKVLVL